MNPTEFDWAYLAGIIDGEGHVAVYHRGYGCGFTCIIRIFNTDHNLIDWIRNNFGGNTRRHNRGKQGEAFGKKPIYMVDWRGQQDILAILKGALPYMIVKRRIAEAIINLLTIPNEEDEMRKFALQYCKEVRTNG